MLSRLPENHYGLIGIKRVSGAYRRKIHPAQRRFGAGTDLSIEVPRRTLAAESRVAEITL